MPDKSTMTDKDAPVVLNSVLDDRLKTVKCIFSYIILAVILIAAFVMLYIKQLNPGSKTIDARLETTCYIIICILFVIMLQRAVKVTGKKNPPPTNDLVSVLLKNAVQAMLPGTINTWLCDEVDGKSRQEALVEAKTTKEVHKILSTVPPHPQNYPKHNEIWNKKRNKHSENDLVLMEK